MVCLALASCAALMLWDSWKCLGRDCGRLRRWCWHAGEGDCNRCTCGQHLSACFYSVLLNTEPALFFCLCTQHSQAQVQHACTTTHLLFSQSALSCHLAASSQLAYQLWNSIKQCIGLSLLQHFHDLLQADIFLSIFFILHLSWMIEQQC